MTLLGLTSCGAGETSRFESKRDAQNAIEQSFCERAFVCGHIEEIAIEGCVTTRVDHACEGIDCDAALEATDEQVDACIDAMPGLACDGNDPTPAACEPFWLDA
jgi:hypothetical protein